MVAIVNIDITPASGCNSSKEQTSKFLLLNEALNIKLGTDLTGNIRMVYDDVHALEPAIPDFKYEWKDAKTVSDILTLNYFRFNVF